MLDALRQTTLHSWLTCCRALQLHTMLRSPQHMLGLQKREGCAYLSARIYKADTTSAEQHEPATPGIPHGSLVNQKQLFVWF